MLIITVIIVGKLIWRYYDWTCRPTCWRASSGADEWWTWTRSATTERLWLSCCRHARTLVTSSAAHYHNTRSLGFIRVHWSTGRVIADSQVWSPPIRSDHKQRSVLSWTGKWAVA